MGYVNVALPPSGELNFQLRTFFIMHEATALSWVLLDVTFILVIRPADPIVKRMTTFPFKLGTTFKRFS